MIRRLAPALCLLAAASCAPKRPEKVVLARGTPVRLMLLAEVHAGQADEGQVVPLMVLEDKKDPSGRILLRRGEPAQARVARSRGAGALSGLINQPARLSIVLDQTKAADGTQVLLSADPSGRRDAEYAFTRDNTGYPRVWEQALNDERRELLQRLAEMLAENRGGNLANDPASSELVRQLADRLGLTGTQALAARGELEKATGLLGQIANGDVNPNLLLSAGLHTVAAVTELTKLAAFVGDRLGGVFRGRTIRAHIGTELTAYVAKDAEVVPQDPPKDP
ncbi:MAG: hypothetical protein N2109_07805 [Fimbriimonadales bacterium]|nr:hypothetical protein [Fimbriimonadales bacterium]